jgi:hypothetical protein
MHIYAGQDLQLLCKDIGYYSFQKISDLLDIATYVVNGGIASIPSDFAYVMGLSHIHTCWNVFRGRTGQVTKTREVGQAVMAGWSHILKPMKHMRNGC